MKNISLGQYYPADSALHRLDPRVKLIGTLIYDKTHPDVGWIQASGYAVSDSSGSL